MSDLSQKHCVPCHRGVQPLSTRAASALLDQLDGWEIGDGPRLVKHWRFDDFATALSFVNRIGAIAEAEGHHPDLALGWGRVSVELWTHAAGGLTENDFVLAARIDEAQPPS